MKSCGLHSNLVAAILLAAAAGAAQEPGLRPEGNTPPEYRARNSAAILQAQAAPAFDVLHYDLAFRPAMATELLEGRSGLEVRLLSPLTALRINAAHLQIDSVNVDGARASFAVDTDESIMIALPHASAAGETLRVDVWYRRLPGVSRPSGRSGYYWYSAAVVEGLPADLGYTMSEPSAARFWLPCVDDPSDKATADIAVTVPSGMVAASNGRLIETRANVGGTITWIWRENHQIAPYLLCLTVSRFAIASIPYVTAVGDTVPIQYYVWREDSAECTAYLPTVRRMVGVLAGLFGEYPFDKYGMTAIVPFSFGGMEHQTITTLNRYLKTDEQVVLHELAHQWWGDLVTCGMWADIWLNESFASYSEALWKESLGGRPALKAYMESAHENFQFASWAGALYGPESQGLGLFSNLVYSKGAWVLHTLRGVMGDSLFFRSLRLYRDRYAQGNATTEDFRAAVESVAGMSMGWFFNQWIYGPGWPVYGYAWRWESGELLLTVQQQQQAPAVAAYRMPIRLRVSFGTGDTTIVVWDSLRTQTFRIPLQKTPQGVEFDPDHWILRQMGSAPPASTPQTFRLDQNFPNPFNLVTVLRGEWPVANQVKLVVCDVLGREVATLVDGYYAAGRYDFTFDARGLPSGVYFYHLKAGPFTATRKMVLAK